jgi:hypothetical protein
MPEDGALPATLAGMGKKGRFAEVFSLCYSECASAGISRAEGFPRLIAGHVVKFPVKGCHSASSFADRVV